jgi:protocatechuate 3,4-dioxygenase beta subunit
MVRRGSRRQLVLASLLIPFARTVPAPGRAGRIATPGCGRPGQPTARETEGPFFKPRSPERASLIEPGMPGTRLTLVGRVLSTSCQPIAGALLDFWHADAGGVYDADGYRCRGHQFADAAGRYELLSVVPGLYPGRTRHFHVKVQAPRQRVLTTQLYFPGEPHNRQDFLFRDDLLMAIQATESGTSAAFDFVLDLT